MMRSDQLLVLIIFVCLFGIFFFCVGYTVYDHTVKKETITAEIIDKWIDPNQGSLPFKVELQDHRIYGIGSFEFQRLELHKLYKMNVYKTYVVIIDERWRV